MNIIIRHALKLTIFSAGIALLLWVLKTYTTTPVVHFNFPAIVIFLFVLTLFTSSFVLWGIRRHSEQFNAFFFSAMIFRFFASIIFILVMVLTGKEGLLFFVLDFFVLYLLYQVFEIISLMTNLRSHLENRGNEDN